ncbi:hypothetical protein EON65_32770 [archaeon]|nr:MAG: hypothetical protein EON65_32770 [archaeon]
MDLLHLPTLHLQSTLDLNKDGKMNSKDAEFAFDKVGSVHTSQTYKCMRIYLLCLDYDVYVYVYALLYIGARGAGIQHA